MSTRTHGLRIGYYMHTPAIGGAEAYLRDLLAHLDRSRFEPVVFHEPWPELEAFLGLADATARSVPVAVHELSGRALAARPQQPSATRAVARRVLTQRVRGRLWRVGSAANDNVWALENVRRLRAAFRAAELDILHVNNGGYPGAWTARLAPVAARLAGVPITVMTVAGTPTGRRFEQPLARTLDAAVARSVDRFVAVAGSVHDGLVAGFGFEASRIVTIPYGIADPAIDAVAARERLRRSLGVDERRLVLGMVGRASPEKGHDVLLAALQALPEPVARGTVVVVVGDGPILEDVRRDAADSPVDVRFLGRVDPGQTLEIVAGLDVLVLPSHTEGLPYVVTEALCLSVPVVATDVGGVREQIVDGETGLLVPRGDARALAAAIGRLATEPSLSARLAAAGRARFLERFTLQRMVAAHEGLYVGLAR